jgi:hypothetical protein
MRILAIALAFGLTGCTAVLGLDERPLDPGDAIVAADTGDSLDSTTDDTSTDDASMPSDSSLDDDAANDATVADTTVADTGKADTGKADTATVDTAVVDMGAPDAIVGPGGDKGQLTINPQSITAADVNLTSEGSLDWAHWGLGSATGFNHKASGGGLVTIGTPTGTPGPTGLSSKNFVWSDGTPTAATSTQDGLVFANIGDGYTFTVPATPLKTRTLRLYVGWYKEGYGTVTATLSDGSAPSVSASAGNVSGVGVEYTRFNVTFRSKASTATVTIKATRALPSSGSASGSMDYFAATLQ